MVDNILTLRERIRSEMNVIADNVSTGGCLSGDNSETIAVRYAQSVGKIEGLAMAERLILDIVAEEEDMERLDI